MAADLTRTARDGRRSTRRARVGSRERAGERRAAETWALWAAVDYYACYPGAYVGGYHGADLGDVDVS